MRIIVIGGNPAGLSAASAIRREHADWDLQVYEMGQYVSYAPCGLPYYIEGKVKSAKNLVTLTPEMVREDRNIPLKLFHKVISVNFEEKTVKVINLRDKEEFNDHYDKLIITTGAKAKIFPELAIEHPRVFEIHTIDDADRIKKNLIGSGAKSGIIIGAGYIGLEMLEAYKSIGIEDLTLIDIQTVFQSKSADYVKKVIEKNGVKFLLGRLVKKLEPINDKRLKVTLDNEESHEANFVQISVGIVPNTDFLKDTKLNMIRGAIVTDEFMRTNIEDVFAAGDCSTVFHKVLEKNVYIPLAPAANKQGKILGNFIAGKNPDPFLGVVGTAAWKVFDLYCGRTGITEKEAKEMGYDATSILIEHNELAHYYPNLNGEFELKMSVLLVFDKKTHLLLGGEITSPSPVGAIKIDILATALSAKLTIDNLQELDLAYAPPFAPIWDPILIAANIARKKCN